VHPPRDVFNLPDSGCKHGAVAARLVLLDVMRLASAMHMLVGAISAGTLPFRIQ